MSAEDDGGHDQTVSVFFLFFALLLGLVLLLGRALHSRPRLSSYLSEPAMVLLVSGFVSFLVYISFPQEEDGVPAEEGRDDDFYYLRDDDGGQGYHVNVDQSQLSQFLLTFDAEAFFMLFLPPIMFNSGYELQRELFFRHIKPIVSFAVVGTAFSGVVTGLVLLGVEQLAPNLTGSVHANAWELLTFGSLITATDTVSVLGVLNAKQVNPHLFSLVFGESAFNDAVAIVLFRTFSRFVRTGAQGGAPLDEATHFLVEFCFDVVACPLLGMLLPILVALVFKFVDFRGTPVLELSLYLLMMYVPFLLAEVLGMSGIITIFVTGMFARRYVEPNVSGETQRNAAVLFHLVAYLAETCIFLNLGLSVFGFRGSFHWPFVGCAFTASLVGRALSVYSISFLHNRTLTHWVEEPRRASGSPSRGAPARLKATVTVAMENARTRSLEEDAAGSNAAAPASSLEVEDVDALWENGGGPTAEEAGGTRMVRRTHERKLDKVIPTKFMHFLWFAGLRGAVAYACARDFPDVNGNRSDVVAATMVIVFFSIVVMGACCEPLLHCLGIQMSVDDEEYMREWRHRRQLDGKFHRFEKRFIYNLVVRPRPAEDDVEPAQQPFHLVGNDGP